MNRDGNIDPIIFFNKCTNKVCPPNKQKSCLFIINPCGNQSLDCEDSALSKTTAGKIISRQLKERWREPRRQILSLLCRNLLISGSHRLKDMKRAKSPSKTQKGISCLFPIQTNA